jgi:hypothetical protein
MSTVNPKKIPMPVLITDPDGFNVADCHNNALDVNVVSGGGGGNVNLIEVGGSPIALGQTTMSASLPVTIASDQTPIQDVIITGNITSTQNVSISTEGRSAVSVQLAGNFAGTLQFEITLDGTNWINITSVVPNLTLIGSWTLGNTSPSVVILYFDVGGFSQFRVRGANITSGTALITLQASSGIQSYPLIIQGINGGIVTPIPSGAPAPLQIDSNGNLKVNVEVPVSVTPAAPTTSIYSQLVISSASNPAVIVPASGTTTIRIYRILIVNAGTATNITAEDSTPTTFSGAIPLVANGSLQADGEGDPLWITAAGKAFQVVNSASQLLVGQVWYTQS